MIGKLKGFLEDIGDGYIIIDVQGVGYMVYVTARILGSLPEMGQSVTFFIETQVREDAIRLFGFSSRLEQGWFRLLQNVQGIGARVALAVLGTLGTEELASAIALCDTTTICRAPGVGKKVAERIVTELKNKAPIYSSGMMAIIGAVGTGGQGVQASVADAVSALCNLGYSYELAANAIAEALKTAGEGVDSAKLIRFGLRELSK
ncbi:MAG: holliday junction DNA helicase RuvA [Candidatus Tokpelaia sp. JSC189]|nr:MAG: holliday junction DNA helicase RuvA [Candidatus Tokpelaia sp. JSC189]